MIVQQLVVILVFSQERLRARPSTLPSCTSLWCLFLKEEPIFTTHNAGLLDCNLSPFAKSGPYYDLTFPGIHGDEAMNGAKRAMVLSAVWMCTQYVYTYPNVGIHSHKYRYTHICLHKVTHT